MTKAEQEAFALAVSHHASLPTSESVYRQASDKPPSVSRSKASVQRRHVHF